jgi:hypothetical protein
MRKLTYALALIAIFLAVTPRPVLACSGATLSFWDAYTASTEIFSGRVIKVEKATDTLNVTFQVLRSWKGSADQHIIVSTASQTTACGIPFEGTEKNEYLVYAYGNADQLYTHAFSRTVPHAAAGADLLKLNIITNPVLIVLIIFIIGFAVTSIYRYFMLRKRNLRQHSEKSQSVGAM